MSRTRVSYTPDGPRPVSPEPGFPQACSKHLLLPARPPRHPSSVIYYLVSQQDAQRWAPGEQPAASDQQDHGLDPALAAPRRQAAAHPPRAPRLQDLRAPACRCLGSQHPWLLMGLRARWAPQKDRQQHGGHTWPPCLRPPCAGPSPGPRKGATGVRRASTAPAAGKGASWQGTRRPRPQPSEAVRGRTARRPPAHLWVTARRGHQRGLCTLKRGFGGSSSPGTREDLLPQARGTLRAEPVTQASCPQARRTAQTGPKAPMPPRPVTQGPPGGGRTSHSTGGGTGHAELSV